MEYGLVGAKLGHSHSPAIHAMLGDYRYEKYEMDEQTFIGHLARRDFRGLNVTIPYKVLAYRYCDALSDTALETGCVNTLVVRPDGSLYGHNTDIGGFLAMVRRSGIEIAGRKAVILGSGGASRTAQAACRRLGAAQVTLISRKGPVTYDDLYRSHADAEIVINTTPVGMWPDVEGCPVDLARLPEVQGVVDVVYNPLRTALILAAEARGIPAVGGLFMLVAQAREAAELFTGQAIGDARAEEIYRHMKRALLNVVLAGMPGSGKTTIGRALAAALQRPFVDADARIERRAACSIPDIFAGQGEAAFRRIESEVIADEAGRGGIVLATGGGAVLRERNVRAMRANGVVLWLTRDIDRLAMDGRPLSKSREALIEMWTAREPLYRGAADHIIDNNGAPEDTLRQAEEAFHEAVDR